MDAKTKAIISHIFFIGWIIALVVNMGNKEEYASYYIRQNLGLIICWIALSIFIKIPVINWVAWIGYLIVGIFWLMSLIWSITDVTKPVPLLGEKFQDWFRTF